MNEPVRIDTRRDRTLQWHFALTRDPYAPGISDAEMDRRTEAAFAARDEVKRAICDALGLAPGRDDDVLFGLGIAL